MLWLLFQDFRGLTIFWAHCIDKCVLTNIGITAQDNFPQTSYRGTAGLVSKKNRPNIRNFELIMMCLLTQLTEHFYYGNKNAGKL